MRGAAKKLRELVGQSSINSYVDRVRAALGALPQEIGFIFQQKSHPRVFETIAEATEFLAKPTFDFSTPIENFIYEIPYSDGTEFERPVESLDELRVLHQQIEHLAQHVTALTKT